MSSRASLACLAIFAAACSRTSFTTDEAADGAVESSGNDSGGIVSRETGDGGAIVATSADGIDGVGCAGKTCKDRGVACGPSDDGCGRALDCGSCAQGGATCNAGACSCTPKTCADLPDVQCGFVSDGCGGNIECGSCDGGHCTHNICTSATCQLAILMPGQCGAPATNLLPDGCSSTLETPACGANETCGGGGAVNECGCTRQTCEQAGAECGAGVADGCGGQSSCGECSDPPGTCNGNHCDRCIAVPEDSLGFEARCAKGTLHHAWACACSGGTCDVPDSAKDSDPSCSLLETTSEHAVYCCTNAGTTP